ncbi:MAG: flavodoxin-dependent (E)-4-hydroxy-3-methylbut-2-enyl-diphosphate synthase [Erysipelotrichaceae bacterium]
MYTRTQTKAVKIGNISIGNQNKVIIQSMTNTKTCDIEATINQINQLEKAGCQIARLAILDKNDALAIKEIKAKTNIPLVADIHFNYQFALICIENGIDKVRINPSNIGNEEHIKMVVDACKEKNIPIRIGINGGSLEKDLIKKYGKATPEAMIESADRNIKLLEKLGFDQIVLSFKSSDVVNVIQVYQLAAQKYPYPLHLGVTEAGSFFASSVRSSCALGSLMYHGIGDTIRISVSANPVEEIKICKELLNSLHLYDNYPHLVSCPTCGRIQYAMLDILPAIEDYLSHIQCDIKVAIMGCPVNGPGEAKDADIGIAGGKDHGILFKHGEIIRTIPTDQIVEELIKEIDILVKERHLQ